LHGTSPNLKKCETRKKMAKQTKITAAAKGKNCTVRITGVCNHNPETTVFAHLNGAGMGIKHNDIHGCFACSDCHAWLDGGYVKVPNMQRDKRDLIHLQAMVETQLILVKEGLIKT